MSWTANQRLERTAGGAAWPIETEVVGGRSAADRYAATVRHCE